MRRSLLLLIVSLTLLVPSWVQPVWAQDSPEATASAYDAAARSGDWHRVASLTHPRVLARVKALMVRFAEGTAEPGDAQLPPLPSERVLAQLRVQSVAELAALEPSTLFERVFTGAVPERARMAFEQTTGYAAYEAVGSVREGDDLAHVVRRMRLTNTPKQGPASGLVDVDRMEVLTVHRTEGQWLVDDEVSFRQWLVLRWMML